MRVVDAICMVPIIANVILAKDNPEMLALVIIADYAIDRVRNTAAGYMDTLIEIKGVRKNLEALNEEEPKDKPMMGESLTLKNVIFDYGNEEEKFVIDELTFKRGSRTLVYGESGEGKSSLANLISGAITPTIGSVPPVDCYYIWQETESIDDTLWHNIVFDNKDDVSEEEVLDLMKQLNMLEWFNRREDGFETMIGEKGCKLSSGQKQRLNIIRLILTMRHHPNYLFIIDEITSNLDSKTRKLAIDLIDRECKSTLIAISHNEGFDSICDHAIFVENHSFRVVK
jgi:ABC-type bacteriocin/lantibiotic exporter with double-glycine peptidase domain